MIGWRTLAGAGMWLAVVSAAQAGPVPLAEAVKPGDCFRVRLDMKLTGEMRFTRDDKTEKIKLTAEAVHEFPERVLAVGKTGLPEKTARKYESARATITVGGDRTQRTLRDARNLVVAQLRNDAPLVYSPAGALTRAELELTGQHFDTLGVVGLLPGKAVGVGDTWKVSNGVAQALCHFEGLTEQALVCKLEEADEATARFSVRGTASGIDLGAMVKLNVVATCKFDRKAGRLVWVEWKQTDEREQGPVSPVSTVEITTLVTRDPIAQPESLGDIALVSVPEDFTPPPHMTHLEYADDKGRFEVLHGREWHLVSQTQNHAVKRLMDRGDFVAQVTITPWTAAEKGKHLSPEEFKEAMNRTPGWEPAQELQAGEVPAEKGKWIYRLSQQGTLDGVEALQNFYLVAGPDGRQVVLAFTMSPKQAERLGTRDLSLVGSVEFPGKQ